MSAESNLYCEWLGIRVPRLEEFATRARTSLTDLVVLAPPRLDVDLLDACARYEVGCATSPGVLLRGARGFRRVPTERILDIRLAGGSADG
ncbi:MAG: hypothetical protein L0323_07085 [Planctomycetes bacterium]|nr:hypothetical protein [Planctomycetota bacterium]